MSPGRKFAKLGWRLALCILLLAWIFQAIFYNEGRMAWRNQPTPWESLTRLERWQTAWLFGPAELGRTLAAMDARFLVLSLVLMAATVLLGVIRWQTVLKVHGLAMPLARTTQISFVAHFFNSFLLGATGGDLLKAYYVARETHHKKTEAVVTVIVDRLLGMFAMLLFATVMMIPNREILLGNRHLKALGLFVVLMTLGCAAFLTVSFWGGVSRGLPGARDWLRRLPRGETLERSLEAFREFGRDRSFLLRILPVSIGLNLVCVLHFLSLCWGFHLRVPFLALCAIVPMVTSIASLPISPSGLGVRENLYVFMLAAVQVPPATALLLSLVGYGTSLFWSAVGGLVYLTLRGRQHLDEIAASSAREDSPA